MNPAIRVLIVDDHAIVREGLQMFLSEEPSGIEVIAEASDGAEAVVQAERVRPDVILMDLVMPGVDGIEAIRRLRASGNRSPILVLTTFADGERVSEAIRAGAIGYLLKDVARSDLLAAVRAAARGQPTLHPEAQQQLIQQVVSPPAPSPFASLTEREREVLRLIARGFSNKKIAATLSLTVGTVKGYVSAVLAKLGVADRTQAALYAVRHGMEAQQDPPS